MPFTVFATAIGTCGVAWQDAAITAFALPADSPEQTASYLAGKSAALHVAENEAPDFVRNLIERVQAHLSGRLCDFSDVVLDWSRVGDFQQSVYRETQVIKPGSTRSYGDIARAVGLGPAAARAVGVALGNNPWPLLVPCHRVVSASGRMTGFSAPGGVRTKTRLLVLEGAELLSE